MSEFQRVIICRSAKDLPRTPEAIGGYACAICDEPLVLTPRGQQIIRDHPGSALLCNACGLLYSHVAESTGTLERVEIGPEAKVQLDEGNASRLANWIRRRAR